MNTTLPDWNLVRAFLAVVDNGSLTGAAQALSASQPTLSRQIGELEHALGTALFERIARGLRLTAAGEALVAPARQMQQAAQSLSLTALGQTQQLAGSIRITASEMTAAHILPDSLTRLRQAYPEIQVELVASNQVQNLLERQADIAIRHTRPAQGALIARHLLDASMGAFAHEAYLARVGGGIELDRMASYDWIGYDQSDLLLRSFRAAGIAVDREFFAFRSDNHLVCWQAALAGMGIAFAPHAVAARWPAMRAVLPDAMVPAMPVWITAHRELRGSPRIKLVFDWLARDVVQAYTGASPPA